MYEHPGDSVAETYDKRRRRELQAGLRDPLYVGSVNLDEDPRLITTGVPLGRSYQPSHEWNRILWRDLAQRVGSPIADSGVPPCSRWFPFDSWPTTIRPPAEGGLDWESFVAMVDVLSEHSALGPNTRVFCLYARLAIPDWDGPVVYGGRLSELLQQYASSEVNSSPSNIWPEDKGWFVWTDWDLSGTEINGPCALIESLERHPELDVLRPLE